MTQGYGWLERTLRFARVALACSVGTVTSACQGGSCDAWGCGDALLITLSPPLTVDGTYEFRLTADGTLYTTAIRMVGLRYGTIERTGPSNMYVSGMDREGPSELELEYVYPDEAALEILKEGILVVQESLQLEIIRYGDDCHDCRTTEATVTMPPPEAWPPAPDPPGAGGAGGAEAGAAGAAGASGSVGASAGGVGGEAGSAGASGEAGTGGVSGEAGSAGTQRS